VRRNAVLNQAFGASAETVRVATDQGDGVALCAEALCDDVSVSRSVPDDDEKRH
jgi:hypothetical protein